jgi:hypothetical protein
MRARAEQSCPAAAHPDNNDDPWTFVIVLASFFFIMGCLQARCYTMSAASAEGQWWLTILNTLEMMLLSGVASVYRVQPRTLTYAE